MNLKTIIIAVLTVLVVSCEDDSAFRAFDHAAQYKKEKIKIEEYISSHYYNPESGIFDSIKNGEVALVDDPNLIAKDTVYNDVNFTMYTYETVEGTGISPDNNDGSDSEYAVYSLENELYEDSQFQDELRTLVVGWQLGMSSFKAGDYDESDPTIPRQYFNSGEGLMIIPSGLAYQNFGSGGIAANETLIFKIVLRTVTELYEGNN